MLHNVRQAAMEHLSNTFICPDSPFAWDEDAFSLCIGNLYPLYSFSKVYFSVFFLEKMDGGGSNLRAPSRTQGPISLGYVAVVCFLSFSLTMMFKVVGFGANVVTILVCVSMSIAHKNSTRIRRENFWRKLVLHFIPAIGACVSLLDLLFLLKKRQQRKLILYHEWFFRSSQLVVWTIIFICLKCGCLQDIICERILCFWWILKSFLGTFLLYQKMASLEVWQWLLESCNVLMDVTFGIAINIIRIKWASSKSGLSSMEDPLIYRDVDTEEASHEISVLDRSYWNLMTFKSINSVMNRGITKQLDFDDLLCLPNDMEPSVCHDKLLSCWDAQQHSSDPFFLKAICYAYGWPYFRLGLLKVLNDCIGFMGPLLLNKLIRFLHQGSVDWDGYLLALSLGLVSVLKSFCDTQYTFHLARLKLKLRSSIMTLIYGKCLHVTLAERSKFSQGEIQTFMSVDADRTANLCNSFHDIWSLPLQIGVALYLLYTQVKYAFLSGLAITILLIPVNKWISELIASATTKMMKQKDERIRRTSEILTHIRTLKMHSWEHLFSSWLMETRSLEVKHLATRKYLDAWCVFFWATTPTLFSLFTFGLYTLMGHELDAATVFTCLALFNNLISPLNSFPWVINGLIDAFISTRRLTRFLSCLENKHETGQRAENQSFSSKDHYEMTPEDMEVIMVDASCSWSRNNENLYNLPLKQVTMSIRRGSLVAIIGEVGSGKSSLLNAMLGEMHLISGFIHSSESVAYAPQVPWIFSGTVRDNILFGKNYDANRYSYAIKACALNADIAQMIGGDMAKIGEKGVNLSGGQRARLALARAIYHECDLYVLDDVLSAVDAHVARWILQNAILGPLMARKTRVLCTHNVQAIYCADKIIVMDKGRVQWIGTSAELAASSYSSLSQHNEFDAASSVEKKELEINSDTECRESLPETDPAGVSEEARENIEVELRKKGRVDLSVYGSYASLSGLFIAVVICVSAVLMQASRNGNDLWLSYWVDTARNNLLKYSTSFYLIVLSIFCLVNSFLTLVRAFSFAFGGLRAAIQVHNTLLNKLITAPVQFFDQTPSGRILNRFSSDLYMIDDSLPFILNILLANFVGLLGIAIVLSYVQVFFLLLLLPFWFVYSKLQFFYRSTSRELRRLDSVSRSPIYSTFTETLDGSSTIRAFKLEDIFFSKFKDHVALYQRTSFSETTASLWLSLRLQLLAAFVISFIAMMAVVGSRGLLPISFGTPGLVGLALSYAAPIVSLLGSFLTSFTETEKEMVSVERALQYMEIPQEELEGSESLDPEWPFRGFIKFENVTMRYMPSLPPALHDVTFTITGGTQVGIVGRTGAGKSSILNALFRLTPTCSGRILVDGLNIADIPVRELRSHLAAVPQSPFLFEGSLRDNLDPLHMIDDVKLWNVLEKCHMRDEVQAAGGLDIHVKESGSSFSVGQRQLLCLARALLRSSKVLCLDECTASIDIQTASVLWSAISTECQGMTVITIAHRISTVLNMDVILILDHGKLVEQGNPQTLLRDESSRFSSFAKASTM